MKNKSWFVVLMLLGLCSFSYAEIVDRIIIVVNDEVITQRELGRRLQPVIYELQSVYSGQVLDDKINELRTKLIDQLIYDKLVLSQAKRKGIKVEDKEIEEQLKTVKQRFKNDEEFYMTLEMQGITLRELEENYKSTIMARKLIDMDVSSKIVITPVEVINFYEKNKELFKKPKMAKVRAITIKVKPERDVASAEEMAKALHKRITEGEDFGNLAKEFSDSVYAEKLGDMGYIKQGEMMNKIDDVIFKLNIGQVSDVIKTDLGFHIFKVEDISPEELPTFEQVSEEAERRIYLIKMKERLDKMVEKLRADAYIEFK